MNRLESGNSTQELDRSKERRRCQQMYDLLVLYGEWESRWAEMEAHYGKEIQLSADLPDLLDEVAELGERRRELLNRYRQSTSMQKELYVF